MEGSFVERGGSRVIKWLKKLVRQRSLDQTPHQCFEAFTYFFLVHNIFLKSVYYSKVETWLTIRAFALSHELDFSGERVAHTRSNEYKHFLFHNFFSDYSNFIKICLERNHKITLKLIQSQPCLFSVLQFSKHL